MNARVFISYRTGDGADKATALARDLDALFGSEQVFLDKDDLPAGSRWRDEIARTLGARPILLVLVTPQYLGAVDAAGRRRIDRADDPARTELAAALDAGAHVIPLMCDGVERTPDAQALPPPFGQLAELTWRRLRAYDWKADVARLAGDLEDLGLVPRGATATAAASPGGTGRGTGVASGKSLLVQSRGTGDGRVFSGTGDGTDSSGSVGTGDGGRGRRRTLLAGVVLALAVAGGVGWWMWQRQPRGPDLTGHWEMRVGARGATVAAGGDAVGIEIAQDGDRLRLTSAPFALDRNPDPDRQADRDAGRQRTSRAPSRVRYAGEGRLDGGGSDAPTRLSIAVRLDEVPAGGAGPIATGTLRGEVGPAGRRIDARLRLDGEPAERVVVLRRPAAR